MVMGKINLAYALQKQGKFAENTTLIASVREAVMAERELLLFQRRELETLNFNVQEWTSLQADYARLSHAASLLETAQFGVEIISEADSACLAQLNALTTRLRAGLEFDSSLQYTLTLLESAQNELQETVYALRHYQQRLDADPQTLREQEQQMTAVVDAARKYRVTPEQLPEAMQRIVMRLDELGGDADLAALASQEAAAQAQYLVAAKKLGIARKKAAARALLRTRAAAVDSSNSASLSSALVTSEQIVPGTGHSGNSLVDR